MELLQFILGSFWHFIGTIILTFVVCANIANIVKAFSPIKITYLQEKKEKDYTADYKNMWNDLLSTWNRNRNNPGDNKK